MARVKTEEKKKHLTRERLKNKRAPIWTYLKTGNIELIRGRTRHWRSGKVGKKIKKKTRVRKKTKKGKKVKGRGRRSKVVKGKRKRKK